MATTGDIEKREPTATTAPATPVVAVYAGGRVEVGPGCSIGDVLTALEAARRAVLGVVLNPDKAATA